VVYVLEAACDRLDVQVAGLRVAIQGFGNVGSWVATELASRGAKVVAASDVHGGVLDVDGLDVPTLVNLAASGRSITEAPNVERITNEELLALECDVLIPAALGEVIHGRNAEHVRARMIVEAANHPVTPEADKLLADMDVRVIPDVLANGGGVTGSYFEWTQNIQQFTWPEEKFNTELKARMVAAFHTVWDTARDRDVSMRKAAFSVAIERVARASRLRGYV
jgi:glutamate dehydrogenase (NAD(P)+)